MIWKFKNFTCSYVIVKVDNTGCLFGWLNRRAKGDIFDSILNRALHLISSYLSCIVHIGHLPRKSTWEALTTDRMSREKLQQVKTESCWNLLRFQKYQKYWTGGWKILERIGTGHGFVNTVDRTVHKMRYDARIWFCLFRCMRFGKYICLIL